MKKNLLNKKSGFSMLELVVVMLIMGTLRGIRISKMGGSDTGAIKRGVKSDVRNAIASVNTCYADKLNYLLCDGDTTNDGTGLDALGTLAQSSSTDNIEVTMTDKRNIASVCADVDLGSSTIFSWTYNGSTGRFTEGAAVCP